MTEYIVTATVSMLGTVEVNASSPEEAVDAAGELPTSAWDIDSGTTEVEFNVTPEVERA